MAATNEADALARTWLPRLRELQHAIRDALRARAGADGVDEAAAAVVRDDDPGGDTIFAIDIDADRVLDACCGRWAAHDAFVLIGEGVEPGGRRVYGDGPPSARLIVDPIDGTRGLMFDKRSAWSLAGVAPERGDETRLSDIVVSAMAELPTSRQHVVDDLEAVRGGGVRRTRRDLVAGTAAELPVRPSRARDLRHGFATVCAFFQGGKRLAAAIDEDFAAAALGGWRSDKAELYSDQYISSGGQLAELVLGRDRFVLDARREIHAALGQPGTLCSRPYDLCTVLVAEEAGVVVRRPDGSPFDAPLDTTTNCSFVAYANEHLHTSLQPLLVDVLREHGCL